VLFKGQGEYKKVISYYREAYSIYVKIDRPIEAAFCETNLGSVFYYTQQYDSCVYYSLKAEKALAEHNYIQIQPVAQGNAGLGYFGLGKINDARQYLEKALVGHRMNSNKKEIAFTLIHLSKVYDKLQRNRRAFELLREAKQLAQEIGSSREVMDASELLAAYHTARQDYKQALNEYMAYSHVKDTLFNQEKMQAITNYQFQYDTEKKEQQIELLSRETAIQQLQIKQRTLLLIFVIGFLSTVAIAVYLWQNRRKIHSEAKLQRDAAKQVLHAEERERRRIATDLHDGVGQMLSAALLNLNQSIDVIPTDSEIRLSVEKAQALLSESYDEMRSISHQMMPNALLKMGLASSIREFVDKINGPKIKVQIDIVGLHETLDEQIETVLYRSIQEAVNNVIKHAEASRIYLQLIKDEDGITVAIEDNGKGFDVKNLANVKGIGLRNIFSRIELINGSVDIDSTPGKGTLFVIHIPGKEIY
jgi:signal transduction histidine kinase